MKILTDEDVRTGLDWPAVLSALENAFAARAANPDAFRQPERVAITNGDDSFLTMPCADSKGWFGVKQVSVVPTNPERGLPSVQAWYTLFNTRGTPALACSATLLTKFRTAATSALAARRLVPESARRLLIIGTGSLAPFMAEAHAQVQNYEQIILWGRSRDKAETLRTMLTEHLNAEVVVAEALGSAVQEADVISLATTAYNPIVRGTWLRPGQHLDCVGAFLPAMAEVDADAVKRASVFVDDVAACRGEAGDLIQAEAAGWSWDEVKGSLSDLVAGQAARGSADDITLFKSVGLALEDLVTAKLLI